MKENENQNHQNNENLKTKRSLLTGMFSDRESTENVYNTLQEIGYSKDDINLVMSDKTRIKYFSGLSKNIKTETKAANSNKKSAPINGTNGASLSVIEALEKSVAFPQLGIVLSGPIAGRFSGASATKGGLTEAFLGSGISESRAKLYESGIEKGNIMIGVHPNNDKDAEYLENNWRYNKGQEIQN